MTEHKNVPLVATGEVGRTLIERVKAATAANDGRALGRLLSDIDSLNEMEKVCHELQDERDELRHRMRVAWQLLNQFVASEQTVDICTKHIAGAFDALDMNMPIPAHEAETEPAGAQLCGDCGCSLGNERHADDCINNEAKGGA